MNIKKIIKEEIKKTHYILDAVTTCTMALEEDGYIMEHRMTTFTDFAKGIKKYFKGNDGKRYTITIKEVD